MIVNEIYIIRVVVGDDHGQDYFQFTMTILFVMTSGMNHVIISHISYVLYIKNSIRLKEPKSKKLGEF